MTADPTAPLVIYDDEDGKHERGFFLAVDS